MQISIEWLAEKLDLTIGDISVCGDSAGGHLASSLSTFRAIKFRATSFTMPHISYDGSYLQLQISK